LPPDQPDMGPLTPREVLKGFLRALKQSWGLLLTPDKRPGKVDVSQDEVLEAVGWNRARHSRRDTMQIQKALDVGVDGFWGEETVTAVMQWQFDHDLKVDGKVGSETLRALQDELNPEKEWRELDDIEIDLIIGRTVEVEAGYQGDPYAAMNLDAEYEGWFDRPKRDAEGRRLRPAERAEQPDHRPHKASRYGPHGGIHIGLSWGIVQFTQDGGSLGLVLKRANEISSKDVTSVFWPDETELIDVLNRSGASGLKTLERRGPRVQKVGGEDLWKDPWPARWEAASRLETFRRAQRDVARASYFEPALDIVRDYGFTGQGALAVAFDMSVQYGPAGARKYFRRAGEGASIENVIAQIGNERLRARRLEVLAHSDVWVHYEDLA